MPICVYSKIDPEMQERAVWRSSFCETGRWVHSGLHRATLCHVIHRSYEVVRMLSLSITAPFSQLAISWPSDLSCWEFLPPSIHNQSDNHHLMRAFTNCFKSYVDVRNGGTISAEVRTEGIHWSLLSDGLRPVFAGSCRFPQQSPMDWNLCLVIQRWKAVDYSGPKRQCLAIVVFQPIRHLWQTSKGVTLPEVRVVFIEVISLPDERNSITIIRPINSSCWGDHTIWSSQSDSFSWSYCFVFWRKTPQSYPPHQPREWPLAHSFVSQTHSQETASFIGLCSLLTDTAALLEFDHSSHHSSSYSPFHSKFSHIHDRGHLWLIINLSTSQGWNPPSSTVISHDYNPSEFRLRNIRDKCRIALL
jgi:hypothetical protein